MSEEESDINETTSSSSSSDEDDEPIEGDINEKDFLKTLSCLKNKDPQIYDKNVQFFSQEEFNVKKKNDSHKNSSEKGVSIKDYEGSDDDSEEQAEKVPPIMTYNEEQNVANEFEKIMREDSSEDENGSILVEKKEEDDKEKQEEEKDYIPWLKGKKLDLNDKQVKQELKPLHDFWNNPDLDKKEEFLKDYILNKRYLEKDAEGNFEDSDLSEDEKLLEAQDNFEHNYNFRFENEDDKTIKRFPRKIEGSVRRKNDVRKRKREEIKKRKTEEKEKKKLEIKKRQKEKLLDVQEKLQKLKEITGNPELGFGDDEIMEDFDPDKYDKKMQQLYDERFYSADVEGKPDFCNFDADDEKWNLEEINMDCEADESHKKSKETRSKRKRKKKKSAYTDICDVVKPVFDPEKHSSFQKYIDEYYNLDCEDFIDDIPCRFKYREVVPNDYGLSVEEILMADDKELNRWVSSKKMFKLRPTHVEKNEVKIYKQKGCDEQLKGKLLPSLYKNDEEEDIDGEENDIQHDNEEQMNVRLESSSNKEQKEKKKKLENMHTRKRTLEAIEGKSDLHSPEKKKTKFKKHVHNGKANNDPISKISDSRLLAYNIKPKQFRAKLKHFKHQV